MADFQAQINEGIKQLGVAVDAKSRTDAAFDFCTAWPIAKTILQFFENSVPVIGKLVIGGIIAIGDGLFKQKNCPGA